MNNDLGFLLIFIILPTALIVSGFWLILFVRRDSQRRDTAIAATSAQSSELTDSDELVESTLAEAEEAIEDTGDESEADSAPPVFAPPPGPSDVDTVDDEDDEEFWTPVAVAIDEAPDGAAENPTDGDTLTADREMSGHTEEILPVRSEDARVNSTQTGEPGGESDPEGAPVDENEPDEIPSGDTANLPKQAGVAPHQEDEEDEARHRRQSGALLVPSTENVRRRANLSNRRVPPIARSSTRDEDSVECSDGS